MTAEAIGKKLHTHDLYLRPFLNSLVSPGLLGKAGDAYWNTRFAQKYFVDERSLYWRDLVQAMRSCGFVAVKGQEHLPGRVVHHRQEAGPAQIAHWQAHRLRAWTRSSGWSRLIVKDRGYSRERYQHAWSRIRRDSSFGGGH